VSRDVKRRKRGEMAAKMRGRRKEEKERRG
jgi:hypothetical protein